MNRDEVITEVARIINEQLDSMNEVRNIAGIVLDFLDSIGYIGYENREDDLPYGTCGVCLGPNGVHSTNCPELYL